MVLTSTSSMIGQEIAAIPLLWVIPLMLYLVTWIVTFSGTMRPGRTARASLALTGGVLLCGLPVPGAVLSLALAALLAFAFARRFAFGQYLALAFNKHFTFAFG